MYSFIRIIIGCIFLLCSFIFIKKSKAIRKRLLFIVFTILSVILVTVLGFVPFENLFVTFDSPKAAYEYYFLGKSNIEMIVEGDTCDFVADRKKDNVNNILIIPKTADGWKVGIGLNIKRLDHKFSNGIVFDVYQYKDTNDYFITVFDTNGGESTISDENNTEFIPSKERYIDPLGKSFVTYYAHLTDFGPNYTVTVNGNVISFGN